MRKADVTLEIIQRHETRFWSWVKKTDGCWLWTGHCSESGYGEFGIGSGISSRPIMYRAHRVAYWLKYKILDPNSFVLHHCDNRPCVNPDHLYSGTHLDNMRDKTLRNRNASGNKNGQRTHPEKTVRGDSHWTRTNPEKVFRGEAANSSKLTETQVIEILNRRKNGEILRVVAKDYGIDASQVGHICNGQQWRHLWEKQNDR